MLSQEPAFILSLLLPLSPTFPFLQGRPLGLSLPCSVRRHHTACGSCGYQGRRRRFVSGTGSNVAGSDGLTRQRTKRLRERKGIDVENRLLHLRTRHAPSALSFPLSLRTWLFTMPPGRIYVAKCHSTLAIFSSLSFRSDFVPFEYPRKTTGNRARMC